MRTTISLDDAVAELAERMAKRENRNFSNLCEVALTAYCEPVRTPADDHTAFIAKVEAAAKHTPTRKKIERVLAGETRRRLTPA